MSNTVSQVVNEATTATAVTSSIDPSVYDEERLPSAVIGDHCATGSSFVPTGTVQFIIDGTNYGSPVALNASGHATISDNALTVAVANPHIVTVK